MKGFSLKSARIRILLLTAVFAIGLGACTSEINDGHFPTEKMTDPGSDQSCNLAPKMHLALAMASRSNKTWSDVQSELIRLPDGFQAGPILEAVSKKAGVIASYQENTGLIIENSLDPQPEPAEIEIRFRATEIASGQTIDCSIHKPLWIYDSTKFPGDVVSFVPKILRNNGYAFASENLENGQAISPSLTVLVPLEMDRAIEIYDPLSVGNILGKSSAWPAITNPTLDQLPLIRFLLNSATLKVSRTLNSIQIQAASKGSRITFAQGGQTQISALSLIGGIVLNFTGVDAQLRIEPAFPQSVSFLNLVSDPFLGGSPKIRGKDFLGLTLSDSLIKGPLKLKALPGTPAITLEGHTIIGSQTSLNIITGGKPYAQKTQGLSFRCPDGKVPLSESPLKLIFSRSPGMALSSNSNCSGLNGEIDVFEHKSWDPNKTIEDPAQIFMLIAP